MGLKSPTQMNNSNRVEQPNIEPGTYPARVVSVVDMGVQPQQPYKGEAKAPCQMIRVTYELVDVFMVDEDGNEIEDKPRWISEEFKLFPLSADLAVSTKRYNTIDTKGDADGDWSLLLGRGVLVAVVNKVSKNTGKTYDNVGNTAVMRPRDQASLAELQNPAYFFDLTEPDPEVWAKLPKWIQDNIKNNINYEGSPLQDLVDGKSPEVNQQEKKAPKTARKAVEPAPEAAADDAEEDAPW